MRRFEIIADQIEQCVSSKGTKILEIGCATGGLLFALKKRGYTELLGSDPAPACAEAARRLYDVEVRTSTLTELIGMGEQFDLVVLVGVLEHLRDTRRSLEIVGSVLKRTGVLFCAQPDVSAFAACVNAPFQQFSTEHVNYFSRTTLNKLLASSEFSEWRVWQWMCEWRAGVFDSVISLACTRSGHRAVSAKDETTALCLRAYIETCQNHERAILPIINSLVDSQEPVFVWGAGTFTRHLLVTTKLAQANILAFVDALHSVNGPPQLCGRPVFAPNSLHGTSQKILVCSETFSEEILNQIKHVLQLPNPVALLRPTRA